MKTWTFTHYTQADLMQYKWWRPLIEKYFDKVQRQANKNWECWLDIDYVKEKYWRFDITFSWWTDKMYDIILELEKKSMSICIECWWKAKRRWDLWRILPLCDLHYNVKKWKQ